ncbi:hypothetical protein MMC28_010400 [Mycoblastus sanguinarius]|nr:hypothetical protein [Mycoblastus sanguinarius]
MADPLSIAAGVIAILGAARRASKGLNLLINVKDAPEGLHDLQEDIFRAETVLEVIKNMVSESHEDTPGLKKVLGMAASKLGDIECLVEYTLTKAGESDKVDRWQWIRKGGKVEKLRRELDAVRRDLTALISATGL